MTVIRDIMTGTEGGIRPETTLAEAVDYLTERHIGGAPVTLEDGQVVGDISELALIDVVFDEAAQRAPVSQYMTREVHVVGPNDSLARAAQMFALYAHRRLPVVKDGKLVGVVSRRDLMNYALRTNETLRDPLVELIPELAEVS